MPEGVEIEIYRRAAETVVGRRIDNVHCPDQWFLKNDTTGDEMMAAAHGATIVAARRKGKLLTLDLDSSHRLGLRFGMTGRLIVDGGAAIDQLEYSSARDDPAWDRFALSFAGGGRLVIRDPRRLGGVELDPDEDRLGFDVFSITVGQLRRRVAVGDVAIKARLLDQQRISGVGNLIADETLWRAGIDPARAAGMLDDNDLRRLQRHLRSVVNQALVKGGSHTGRLHDARRRGGRCPRDGEVLLRRTVGGRTTYSCPSHQS